MERIMIFKVLSPRRRHRFTYCFTLLIIIIIIVTWSPFKVPVDNDNASYMQVNSKVAIDFIKKITSFKLTKLKHKTSTNNKLVDEHLKSTNLLQEQKFEEEIRANLAKAVYFGDEGETLYFSEEEMPNIQQIMKEEGFNTIASDRVPLNRTGPDNRIDECKSLVYENDLPSTSVVIPFFNEHWTTLLRTIHSILNHSPPRLIHEIILSDDCSDKEELKGRLEYYVKNYLPKKVKIIRGERHVGLVVARTMGIKAATGRVVVFMESHCEVNVGWLEPLLERIKKVRTVVAVPTLHFIDEFSLEISKKQPNAVVYIGGFMWSGDFAWNAISQLKMMQRPSQTIPYHSPVMAGGVYAIDRNFFWELGGYDEGMTFWGGENMEMSFRTWMCGGRIESFPCSIVNHIFHRVHPFHKGDQKDTYNINLARMAEVWMDDYKRLFYIHHWDLQKVELGDLSARMKLREQLKCASFKWYLHNIYTSKVILDENVLAFGKVSNMKVKEQCLDTKGSNEMNPFTLSIADCFSKSIRSQFMTLTKKNELRREDSCAELSDDLNKVRMVICNENENHEWEHSQNGAVVHKMSGRCLSLSNYSLTWDLSVAKCDDSMEQRWKFEVYLD